MAHVEKRGPGRWRARYRDPDGRERSRTFGRRIDAERWLTSVEHAKLSGAYVDPANGRVAFAEWAAHWLEAPGKRPSAFARDEAIVRVHLSPTLGNRALGTITPADVQALVTTWSTQSEPRTVRRQYGVLRAVLNAAVAAEIIARSPCRGIRLPAVTQPTRHVVTGEELARIAAAMGDYGPMASRCRPRSSVGRVRRLAGRPPRLPPLDAGGRRAPHQRPGRPDGDGSAQVTGRTPHDGCPSAPHGAALRPSRGPGSHRCRRRRVGFHRSQGGPLDYAHFRRRVWGPATVAVNLRGLAFHDLRRANATGMVLEGVDLKTAQTRLSHSDPRLTLAGYTQATSAADAAAAERLGTRFMEFPRPARGLGPR